MPFLKLEASIVKTLETHPANLLISIDLAIL